jgi:adenosylhomocysteine nucleosidase
MKILVTFALETEFAPWRARHEFRSDKRAAAETYLARIGGSEVEVLLTGVGPARAGAAVRELMRGEPGAFNFCVSSGLAGALRPTYRVGQVLAARSVFSETPRADMADRELQSSEALISFAPECGSTLVDRFYTAGHVVAKAEEKRHLGETADAVEMESFDILYEAHASGIPAVAIRAISDSVDEDLPLDMADILNSEGQVSVPRVLGQVARHPAALPGLMRLGRQSKAAAESLAGFLDNYIAAIARRAESLDKAAATAGSKR